MSVSRTPGCGLLDSTQPIGLFDNRLYIGVTHSNPGDYKTYIFVVEEDATIEKKATLGGGSNVLVMRFDFTAGSNSY